jgi:hypothetical protein
LSSTSRPADASSMASPLVASVRVARLFAAPLVRTRFRCHRGRCRWCRPPCWPNRAALLPAVANRPFRARPSSNHSGYCPTLATLTPAQTITSSCRFATSWANPALRPTDNRNAARCGLRAAAPTPVDVCQLTGDAQWQPSSVHATDPTRINDPRGASCFLAGLKIGPRRGRMTEVWSVVVEARRVGRRHGPWSWALVVGPGRGASPADAKTQDTTPS